MELDLKGDIKKMSVALRKAEMAVEALMQLPPTQAFNVIENMKEMLREHFHGTDTSSSHGSMEGPQ